MECVNAALEGGADFVVLCDTNGGTMPFEIQSITEEVKHQFPAAEVGIHCHEDTGMAVASSIMAVQGGASMVQGTFLGFGERCGNANLCTIIANLQLKMGYTCIPKEKMEDLTVTARYMADVANLKVYYAPHGTAITDSSATLEIENSDENVDSILDAAYSHPALTDQRLLGMLQ